MMNAVHLHLTLVHIPIVLFPLATILLALQYLKPNNGIRTLACGLLIFSAVVSGSAYLTGEEAEEISEKIPGVVESVIEDHGDAAFVALWLSIGTAVLAAIALFKVPYFPSSPTLMLVLSALTSFVLFWVGYQGGKIRHPEAFAATSMAQEQDSEKDDD